MSQPGGMDAARRNATRSGEAKTNVDETNNADPKETLAKRQGRWFDLERMDTVSTVRYRNSIPPLLDFRSSTFALGNMVVRMRARISRWPVSIAIPGREAT